VDKGAHFYRCDLQVHTPRDLRWTGPDATSSEEREAYAETFVKACREKGIQAVAITDHHCMAFLPYIRAAADAELWEDGSPISDTQKLTVFPGMELTLGVPCQAILIFDADFPNDMFSLAMTALAITQSDASESKVRDVIRLGSITTFSDLKAKLDEHEYLRGRYIILPNVTDEGQHSLLRAGQADKYKEMHCVGGYSDGLYANLREGTKNKIGGRDAAWGHKRIACIQTSDSRRADHTTLGAPSTWIKWAAPTAEALRQACLAQESRISHAEPLVPETYIASVSVSNSSFLGPFDLEFNRQYSSLIGGRGTGKSTVLEYIRWALCDQPPSSEQDETPNYQARRRRLIDGTLKPFGSTIDVTYVLNGVPHLIRRASADGTVQMKIGTGDLLPCTEDEVRALLPIQAYSQKQLSDVSVRIDELTRFITAPIKADLDRLRRSASDGANRIRETYATRQRFRELSRALSNRALEERSIAEQANSIRSSLTGLSDTDRALLDQGRSYHAASSIIDGWRAGATTLMSKVRELVDLVAAQQGSIEPVPNEPASSKQTLEEARSQYADLLRTSSDVLKGIESSAQSIADDEAVGPWARWTEDFNKFQVAYTAALERSSSHRERLEQLRGLEARVSELSAETTRMRESLGSLSSSQANYDVARGEWQLALAQHDELVDRECARLTERSGGIIRVGVRRHADSSAFVNSLRQSLQGSRVPSAKVEALAENIISSNDPQASLTVALTELEALADYDPERGPTEALPPTPILLQFGFSSSDLDRISQHFTPEDWLTLSLTPIEAVPVYEFRSREGEYIPFENASAGQQATALLKTLLNQPGPPLIIDQPEEDLDNPVMIEIVDQIWQAKQMRQIVFASHNANLVVNGDAELVAWFGYRTTADQSRGTIKGVGAIDIPRAREAIKQIMEGGEEAFRLRREKYGF
jgi:type III restriction enzyme